MKYSKYVAVVFALLLVLGLVACSQQAQEPEEPPQEVQETVPVTAQPLDVKQEVEPSAPVEETPGVEDGPGEPEEPEAPGEPEEPGEPVEPSEPVEPVLYTDVNETVYATGTVNIRASWSAASEKLGSMGYGESVTRTGVPIPGTEAEGWSRVCLADGSTAYMHSSLLSTTQPSTQPSTQPTTQPSYQAPATGDTGGSGTGTQAPATGNREGWNQEFYETLNDYQKAQYEAADAATRDQMQAQLEVHRNLQAQGYYNDWDTRQETQDAAWRRVSGGN